VKRARRSRVLIESKYWSERERDRPWLSALADVDQRGDKTALVRLLRDGPELPNSVRHHIADLIDRYALAHPRGRRRTPSYTATEKQGRLAWAADTVRANVGWRKVSPADAITEVARWFKVPADTLEAARRGKHGGLGRAKKRRR